VEFYFEDVDPRTVIVRADGGLNRQTAVEFVSQLEKLIEGGLRRIVVDCGGLDYISSYGLSLLLRLHGRLAKSGGDVKLAAVQSKVVTVLGVLHLDQVFELYPDVNRAVLAFRPKADA
jgi:anti-sigma B factor antagonist